MKEQVPEPLPTPQDREGTDPKLWLMAFLIALLAVTPRLFFLDVPFERDEGAYAYIGHLILNGKLPYLDAFDHKPPAVFYLYSLAFKLFGENVVAPRLLALLFLAIAGVGVFVIIRKFDRRFVPAFFATVLFGMATCSPAYTGFNSNTEIFTLPFIVWGIWFLLGENLTFIQYGLAGLLFGMGMMVKQPVAIIAMAAFVYRGAFLIRTPRKLIVNATAAAIGMIIPFAFFATYFAAMGGFTAFWNGAFGYNFGYISVVSWNESLFYLTQAMKRNLQTDAITWVAGIMGTIAFLCGNAGRSQKYYFLCVTVGAVLATAMGKFFYGHYFIFLLPFLCIAAGLGLASLMSGRFTKVAAICASLMVIVSGFLLGPYLSMPQKSLLESCYGTAPFYQSVALGKYMNKIAPEGATAFIIGSEAQIFFYGGLKSSTRVFYFYPLMVETQQQARLREETLNQLLNNSPDYILLVNNSSSHFISLRYPDPFIIRLFRFLSTYRLTAISAYDREDVMTVDPTRKTPEMGLANEWGSILVLKRSTEPLP